MGFFDDLGKGLASPFTWGYDHVVKPMGNRFDKLTAIGDKFIDKVSDTGFKGLDAAGGLLNLFGGSGLMWIGLGIAGLIVINKVL